MTPQEALNQAEQLCLDAANLFERSDHLRRKASVLINWANAMLAIEDMAKDDADLEHLMPEAMVEARRKARLDKAMEDEKFKDPEVAHLHVVDTFDTPREGNP